MILIKKNKEPYVWQRFRVTPGATYESKPELVESLLDEQGYICAYCMRPIPCKDKYLKSGKENGALVITDEDHRVEHIRCRENHGEFELDYDNMVICCPGHIGAEEHCDRLKGSSEITLSPLNANFIQTISYGSDGTIKSSNSTYDLEMNAILNLNTELLKKNRYSVLRALIETCKKCKYKRSALSHLLKKYENKHLCSDKGNPAKKVAKYNAYCGVAIYYLKKKLNSPTVLP